MMPFGDIFIRVIGDKRQLKWVEENGWLRRMTVIQAGPLGFP